MTFDLQRANVWKRISAFLFDVILLAIACVLCAWGLSALLRFDAQYQTHSWRAIRPPQTRAGWTCPS